MSTTNHPRPHHQFNAKRFPFSLWRLSHQEYLQLRSRSFPIRYNDFFLLRLSLDQENSPNELNLPKALLVLEEEFGQSSTHLDSWKQTFSFPFLLAIDKPTGTFRYVLKVEDYRGGLEFNLYRVVDDFNYVGENLQVYHLPIADEFSEDEIEYVITYLWGFLQGCSIRFSQLQGEIKPFFRHVDASHVIYGYWEGKFVEEVIEDSEEYETIVQKLEERYGEPAISDSTQVSRIQAMIQTIEKQVL